MQIRGFMLHLAESFSSCILEGCVLPITSIIDLIKKRVMMKMIENRSVMSWTMMLCPEIEKKLAINIQAPRTMSLMRF